MRWRSAWPWSWFKLSSYILLLLILSLRNTILQTRYTWPTWSSLPRWRLTTATLLKYFVITVSCRPVFSTSALAVASPYSNKSALLTISTKKLRENSLLYIINLPQNFSPLSINCWWCRFTRTIVGGKCFESLSKNITHFMNKVNKVAAKSIRLSL